jgi:cyclomaltodextrinase
VKLASAIQFTFAGAPCIYYGDEIGLSGGQDPGCRKCMEWDETKQDRGLFDFFAGLVRLRKKHRAFRDGAFELLHAEAGGAVLAYAREADGERFVVALNGGKRKASLVLPAAAGAAAEVAFGDGEANVRGPKLRVALPPLGFSIVRVR